jgi:hypothetical protein
MVIRLTVVTPISIPEFPPEGPWAAYVLIVIWIPMVLGICFLIRPSIKVTRQLSPHRKWLVKQFFELPIKGIGVLASTEIIAVVLPPLFVLSIRALINPVGWQTWSEVSLLGGTILLGALFIWIAFDAMRINQVRAMLVTINRQDVDRLKKYADIGLGARRMLRKFSGRDDPAPITVVTEEVTVTKKKGLFRKKTVEEVVKQRKEEREGLIKESGKKISARSLQIWAGRALMARKLTPQGLAGAIALGSALELAKIGAGRFSDYIDDRMQREFDKIYEDRWKTLLNTFFKDTFMGALPIVLLALLPQFL